MIPYILHVSILIAAGFLFYKLALKKLTFYVLNRWVLLTCLLAAFLVPLMPMPRQLSWSVATTATVTRPAITVRSESAAKPESPAGVATAAKPMDSSRDVVRTAVVKPKAPIGPKHIARQGLIVKAKDTAFRDARADAMADSKIPVVPRTEAHVQVAPKRNVDMLKILFYLYVSGVIILALNLLRQMVMLLQQRYKSPVIRDGSYLIVTTAGMQGPCSFGNIIFIHPSEYDPETYQQILLHEKIHAGGWHTMDILFAELGIIFQWFNPFIWLFRRELENNLEFLTDRNVLRHPGVERAAYQLSLVKVAAPNISLNITSNYNQSLLKRRIIMMNAQNSSRHTAWKYLFLLPIFILLAGLLNRPVALAQTVRVHVSKAPSTTTVTPVAAVAPIAPAAPDKPSDTIPPVPNAAHSVVIVSDVSDVTPGVQSVVNSTVTSSVTANVVAVANVSVVPEVQVTVPTAPAVAWPVSDTSKPGWVDRTEGAWFIISNQDKKEDKVNIELRGENDDHNWNSSFSVPRSQLSSLNSVGKADFTLTREAGSIHFTGQFDGEQGFGHYKFQPDAAYFAHLRDKKIVGREDELMTFFMLDIKKSYVDMLQANGFADISRGHLISMAALHIDEVYIKSIRESGYNDISESQLITFQALHIDKPFIDDLRRAGYDHLEASRVISFKSLKIDGDYLRKFPPSTPAHDIITYKSLHIDSAYVASLKRAGYPDLSSRDIVSMKSMKVDADYIKGFNNIGYKDIPVHSLISFKSLGITPEYVKGFSEAGYQDIPENMLISFKSMGVTPDYIKSFQEVGFKDLSKESVTSMKALNITPAYVKGFLDLGYKDIKPHNLTSLKAMNITPEFVKSFNAIGFKDIPLNQLSSLKAMGVTPDYVTKMKGKGFVSDDLNKYIRLKNAFE